ncbi:MAG TPA: efflux RND transporter periplasmic adaptor subunit [Desulfobacterales bacterium]|nr:efflux RND transporter periplasmic adaptor subunit [Desulfobacterales bacterium]
MTLRKWTLAALAAVALGTAVWHLVRANGAEDAVAYRTALLERGPMVAQVSTTGTLNAVITVQVGTQVSGQIKELLADFNSAVSSGQVIARIDSEIFEARVRQAQAELEVARANVRIQQAGVERAEKELANADATLNSLVARTEKSRVTLENSRRNMERRRTLFQSGSVSESQTDDAQTSHGQASAQLKSDLSEEKASESQAASRQAGLKSARAQVVYAVEQVRLKEAALHQAEVDFKNTFIRSPVDGVVIERAVDIGQTVAASFQSPKLFTIAQDLRQMQVETDVDEADIGRVHVGQSALFTVDAFPGSEFHGEVLQIRKHPRTVQNVVTYTVVVSTQNEELRLLPGMTANIQIIVDERKDVLKVPNAALRFKPADDAAPGGGPPAATADPVMPEERLKQLSAILRLTESQQNQVAMVVAEARERLEAVKRQDASPEEQRRETRVQRDRVKLAIGTLLSPAQREKYLRWASGEAIASARGRVYLVGEKGKPTPADLVLGINDGTFTEVLSGPVSPGQAVILGIAAPPPKPAARAKRFGF